MNNDMTVREDDFNSSLIQIESTQKMCEALMRTPHYAKMGKDGIFAIVTTARSLGIDPIRALNGGLYFVQGRVGMSTELMASLIREKGHSIVKDVKSNANVCVLNGKRGDNGDTWTITFSIDDAKRAGIYKDQSPWGKYPQVMCYNRAMSTLARQLFPDVIKGAGYEKDELEEIAKSRTFATQPQQRDEFEDIKTSISKEKVDELALLINKCPESYKNQVWSTLEKMNIYSFEQISEETYSRIKSAALKQIESNVKRLDIPSMEEIEAVEISE